MADEGAVTGAVIGLQLGQGDDLIDDAGQFKSGFGAVDLQRENAAIEVIQPFVEDADEPDVLAARVLQVRQPGDHFLTHQPVCTPAVGFAGLLGVGLWLTLAPLQAQATGHGDGVDEHGVVLVQDRRITEARAHGIEVGLAERLVVAQRRVRSADVHREVTTLLPGARTDRVASPAFHREITSLKIKEQRGRGFQCPELRGFADAAFADEHAFHATALGQALVCSNDGEAHLPASSVLMLANASATVVTPSAPRLRAISYRSRRPLRRRWIRRDSDSMP